MSLARPHHPENCQFRGDFRSYFAINHPNIHSSDSTAFTANRYYSNNNHRRNYNSHDFPCESRQQYGSYDHINPEVLPTFKRRKFSATTWENCVRPYDQPCRYEYSPSSCNKAVLLPPRVSDGNANAYTSASCKRNRSRFEDEDTEFMSRDEIERYSPSRKDGIDVLQETHLRYSYCAFLQNLGFRLELPQTTIGTAMVLCHRFFVRRSHACHDRFMIATAALFLSAKSEETPCPLNNMLRASSEILHKQDFNLLYHVLPINWFEQYRERVIEAEQMILTTLNFELNVQHPYDPLTSILNKLGIEQSVLVNLALSLVSEGAYRSVASTPVFLSWRIDMLFIESFIHLKLNYGCVVDALSVKVPYNMIFNLRSYTQILQDQNYIVLCSCGNLNSNARSVHSRRLLLYLVSINHQCIGQKTFRKGFLIDLDIFLVLFNSIF